MSKVTYVLGGEDTEAIQTKSAFCFPGMLRWAHPQFPRDKDHQEETPRRSSVASRKDADGVWG